MIEHPNLIPITVVAAVAIFLAREILELIRRATANRRKYRAIKALLAAECERNQWFIQWLRNNVASLLEALKLNQQIIIKRTAAGFDRLAIMHPGDQEESSPIPLVKTAVLDKYLFEAASLNAKLFKKMESVGGCLIVLQHLREGLIEHVAEDPEWLDGWADYALAELVSVEKSIASLYKLCAGKAVTPQRVR